MAKFMKIKIGYDFEYPAVDEEGFGYPACLIFPPQEHSISELHKNRDITTRNQYLIYNDGRTIEMGGTPRVCRELLLEQIARGFERTQKILDKYGEVKGLKLKIAPLPMVPTRKEWLAKCGPEAFESGCEPDFSAYNGGKPNKSIDYKRNMNIYSGAHIHLQFEDEHLRNLTDLNKMCKFVQFCDILAGILAVIFEKNDLSKLRRKYYGKAGTFRIKSYGIEYRVLDASILKGKEGLWCILGMFNVAYHMFFREEKNI